MTAPSLHLIEVDLAETWLEAWVQAGVCVLEELLTSHAAFAVFLARRGYPPD